MNFLRSLAALLLFLPALAPAQPAGTGLPQGVTRGPSIEGVTEYRLANGLKVLLIPDRSIDTMTVNVTYLVGSRQEGYGETGMAHLLEHLMFRGTRRFPGIKAGFQQRGVRYNGSTSFDRTNYFGTFPASEKTLAYVLAAEADRMVNASIARKDLDAEMTVVRNEFESGENSAANVLRERVAASAYMWHGYGRAIIGARSDIENVPIERLRAFYRYHYQPDNAVLLISGKIDEAAALALAQKSFGPIRKPARKLVGTYTVEPTQDGERTVTLRRAGDVQIASALYHIPPGTHPEYPSIDVLVALLNNVPGGRLHKALVETGLASSIFGTERQQREAGFAYFGANIRRDASIDAGRDALLGVLESFASKPATEEEVDLARRRLLNDIELTLADSRELTMALSECAGMGDWRVLFLYRDRLKEVTAASVQAAALRYFKPANRTLGIFLPTTSPDRAEIPGVPDLAAVLKDYRGAAALAQGENFNPTPANLEARVIRTTLPGGMKLALLPKKTRGATVVAQLALQWGDEQSKANRAAACGATSGMLLRGTRKNSREQLRNRFDKLNANVAVDGEGGSIETVGASLPEALRLMAEVLRQPSFPDDEFEQLRRSTLTSIDTQRSDPSALAGLALTRHLNPYPPTHWLYTTSLDERSARIKGLTLDDVRRCYADFYGASDSELAVVGDFDPEQIKRLAEELFGDWKSPRPYTRIPLQVASVAPVNNVIETPDKANAVLRSGVLLRLRDDDPDYPALLLGNYLLGGSSDSRLVRRIREKEGLSYSVGSFLSADSFYPRGSFGIFAIYAPQNRARIEASLNDEIRKAFSEGFTAEEVDAGKKGFLQARALGRSNDAAVAGRLVSYLVLGRTFAWDEDLERKVAALTPQAVLDAMRRHIDPTRLSVIKAGDFANLAATPAPSAAAERTN
ncbi:MAG TPA: pitrilysin family protein [Burkholderiales bacterium]|nr:pitrilysin family protein [Burkholderiales bacterium]